MTTHSNSNERGPWEDMDADLEKNTVAATDEQTAQIDNALGLQLISIRLQHDLITKLKMIAEHHQVGYQPLIRDLLNRFAASEIRCIAIAMSEKTKQFEASAKEEKTPAPMEPIDNFLAREYLRQQA